MLSRKIGLIGVIFFIFGYVVGAGILIQAVVAARYTGPALWLAFIIAGIPALISAIVVVYIVSALPVSGGTWVYSSRLGSPFIGFIVLASIMLHIIGALALLAVGFGTYFEKFIPGSMLIAAILIIVFLYVINVLGVKIAVTVQIILAICGDFLVIFLFIIFGVPHIKLINLTGAESGGLFPNGFFGIIMGAIILSFSFAGFAAVIEISGEVKNPKRNVPIGLICGFILVTTTYILVSLVITGVADWRTIQVGSTLIDIAALYLPAWFLVFLNILILIAIASTIHGVIMAYSRDLFAAGRDKILPQIFAKVNKRFGTPHASITFVAAGAIILLFFINDLVALSVLCNFTITIPTFVLAYIPLNLKKFKNFSEKSKLKINRKTLMILVIFSMIYSIFVIVVMIIMEPMVLISAAVFYCIAIAYYFARKYQLKKRGIDLIEECKKIPEEASTIN